MVSDVADHLMGLLIDVLGSSQIEADKLALPIEAHDLLPHLQCCRNLAHEGRWPRDLCCR